MTGVVAGVVMAAALLAAPPPEPPADLVVLDGRVLTVDASFREARAVAIRDGVFVKVGTTAEVRALVGPRTRVIDAGGRTVIPGLIDSHVHALGVAEYETRDRYRDLRSIAEILAWVRDKAAGASPGTWIWSPRVFPTRLAERRLPTREELDGAAPGHPVAVDAAYALVVNTAALRAAGIGPATPAPPGGAIVKDATGQPTGLLRNVGGLLDRFQPAARPDRLLGALEDVHRRYNHAGITSVIERGADLAGYRSYERLRAEGRQRVRATVTLRVASDGTAEGTEAFLRSLPFRFGDGDDRLRVGPLKMVADGGILAGTAYMREPYGPAAAALYGTAEAGYRGFLTLPAEKIRAIVRTGHRLGWQMVAHVTGDAGVDTVLDAYEAADLDRSIRDRRFTLIHAYFPSAEVARRAARLGVAVDTQPAWYYKDADALLPALGAARLAPFIGLAEWLRAGVTVALNTDHMFGLDPVGSLNPYNPFLTMAVAVTRRTEGGQVIGPEQAVSRPDALRMMTVHAAYLSFDERRKGSIEVGKLGDLAVLSDDYLACPPERIRDIRAEVTVLGGEVVYESAGEKKEGRPLARSPLVSRPSSGR
jgi:predicted amidohydrolase YtcJ